MPKLKRDGINICYEVRGCGRVKIPGGVSPFLDPLPDSLIQERVVPS
jgi:hypothetical protein